MRHHPNVQAPRRTGAFTLVPLLLFVAVTVASFWVATQWAAAQNAVGHLPGFRRIWPMDEVRSRPVPFFRLSKLRLNGIIHHRSSLRSISKVFRKGYDAHQARGFRNLKRITLGYRQL